MYLILRTLKGNLRTGEDFTDIWHLRYQGILASEILRCLRDILGTWVLAVLKTLESSSFGRLKKFFITNNETQNSFQIF